MARRVKKSSLFCGLGPQKHDVWLSSLAGTLHRWGLYKKSPQRKTKWKSKLFVHAHVCVHTRASAPELNEISQNKVSALRRSFLHWTVQRGVQRGGSTRLAGSVGFSFVSAPNCSPVGRVHTRNRRLWLFTSCLLSLDRKNEQGKQARASPASEMGFIPPSSIEFLNNQSSGVPHLQQGSLNS